MDKLRQTLTIAVVLSMFLPIHLWTIINSATTGTRSGFSEQLQFVSLLGLAIGAIVCWLRYLRGYVDYTIERKLREIGKQ